MISFSFSEDEKNQDRFSTRGRSRDQPSLEEDRDETTLPRRTVTFRETDHEDEGGFTLIPAWRIWESGVRRIS